MKFYITGVEGFVTQRPVKYAASATASVGSDITA